MNDEQGRPEGEGQRAEAYETVRTVNSAIEGEFSSVVVRDLISAAFRQRSVPSYDPFTDEMVGSFRRALSYKTAAEGAVRKLLSIFSWELESNEVTLWTTEPTVALVVVVGNGLDLVTAREIYMREIEVLNPLSSVSTSISVSKTEAKGRWAGRVAWRASTDLGQPRAVVWNANMCGMPVTFAVRPNDDLFAHVIMTPQCLDLLAEYPSSRAPGPSL
ncbi:hypothetical protein B0A55_13540 [Friedmanniomyces simplex]|uniref:Uncharacterized protein n=1 Tax=Friedmanniomyces simplex TaxID=329884 RepID=A0A4U0VKX5_9PEZI|nr:hypothetical protein B0A55_13540 [Friedmanniomyces simplex]